MSSLEISVYNKGMKVVGIHNLQVKLHHVSGKLMCTLFDDKGWVIDLPYKQFNDSISSIIDEYHAFVLEDARKVQDVLNAKELESIITELDQCIQEEVQGVIALSEKKAAKFKSAVDRLDKLRLDLYNDRLL